MVGHLKNNFERFIELTDRMLIQLFLDSCIKNREGVNSFVNDFRELIEKLLATYRELSATDKREFESILIRLALIWKSLFIDGDKCKIPDIADAAIEYCLHQEISKAVKILKTDRNNGSMQFLMDQFGYDKIDETLKHIARISKERGEQRARDFIFNTLLGDKPFIHRLVCDIVKTDDNDWWAKLYVEYQQQNPLEPYLNFQNENIDVNYFLDFIKWSVRGNEDLENIYERWLEWADFSNYPISSFKKTQIDSSWRDIMKRNFKDNKKFALSFDDIFRDRANAKKVKEILKDKGFTKDGRWIRNGKKNELASAFYVLKEEEFGICVIKPGKYTPQIVSFYKEFNLNVGTESGANVYTTIRNICPFPGQNEETELFEKIFSPLKK